MYEVTVDDRSVIAEVPQLMYVRFNRFNKMAVACNKERAEGIVLNNGSDVYRLVDRKGLEHIPKCYITEKPIDGLVAQLQARVQELQKATEEIQSAQDDTFAEILLAQADMAIRQEEQDDVLSEILLGTLSL